MPTLCTLSCRPHLTAEHAPLPTTPSPASKAVKSTCPEQEGWKHPPRGLRLEIPALHWGVIWPQNEFLCHTPLWIPLKSFTLPFPELKCNLTEAVHGSCSGPATRTEWHLWCKTKQKHQCHQPKVVNALGGINVCLYSSSTTVSPQSTDVLIKKSHSTPVWSLSVPTMCSTSTAMLSSAIGLIGLVET